MGKVESNFMEEKGALLGKMMRKQIGKRIYKNFSVRKLEEIEWQLQKANDIIAKGEPWTDPDFKPNLDSLCYNGTPEQFEKCE